MRLAELELAAQRASIRDIRARLVTMQRKGVIELAHAGKERFVRAARSDGQHAISNQNPDTRHH
jgi:hypothetical protein